MVRKGLFLSGKFCIFAINEIFIDMSSKSIEMLTEEQRKLHEEFTRCQNWEEVEEFLKKVETLNESQKNNEIPYYDMTVEEYCKKYNLKTLDEVMEKYGF